MGVQGLWELLAPVGRRVSVETLAGKKLAIDASIWMVQFMKAMRDDQGEMVRNAHILGFFRRICKLLFLRTKPVFVFDGATPALKRRTVIARRRQRENAQAKIRKTAEKLLLNHLKAMRLKELANDLASQTQKSDAKGKKVIADQIETAGNAAEGNNFVPFSCNQEALDELLAASLAAEEDGSFSGNASASRMGIPTEEEEEEDEDEEMILPAINGKVDPAVLAALPPSMQLDLLVQMRERLMAENRQKYQKVKKAPAKFSELQIQAYLKTVAFRREIDEVQKSAAGKGVGGVQTSRIASEANREFIFSSSFTGDKQVLTSAGGNRHGEKLHQTPSVPPPSEPPDHIASTKNSNTESGSVANDTETVFDGDIETYMDEMGRVRVSRLRAMGIRMTRDLQRNLDLMKEFEQYRLLNNESENSMSDADKNAGSVLRTLPHKIQLKETSCLGTDVPFGDTNDKSIPVNENLVEISFEDDGGNKCSDDDDHLFSRLVAGDPVLTFSADSSPLNKHSFDSESDCDWEEGLVEEKGDSFIHDVERESKVSLADAGDNDESEVEWVEGNSDVLRYSSPASFESRKTISKGVLEEEADFQEAIKRSMEDLRGLKYSDASLEDEISNGARQMARVTKSVGSLHQENDDAEPNMPLENEMQPDISSHEVVSGVEGLDSEARMKKLNTDCSLKGQLAPSMAVNPDSIEGLIDKAQEMPPNSHAELFQQDTSEGGNLFGEIGFKESITHDEEKGVRLIAKKLLDTGNAGGQVSTYPSSSRDTFQISDVVLGETPQAIHADAQQNVFKAAVHYHVRETTEQGESSVKESTINHDSVQKLPEEKSHDNIVVQKGDGMLEFTSMDEKKKPIEVTESSLEEEMLNLSKERMDLGDEQRKLERNAESVSSEMFVECQELLQMFGLPYIIAPMEAEAQCAYMELAGLVDGVVTDDSDVFLFGGRSAYKNIFDDRKYVETYFMKDIENELGLTREKLIRMALLLGSDYTEGVSGIGIVNAIEVVNAFPEDDGLSKFREWIESPDPTILGKLDVQTGSCSQKSRSKVGGTDETCSNNNPEGLPASDQNVSQTMDYNDNVKQNFMDKHRNVSKNWHIPSSFPNEAIISAYASPQVDQSTEAFLWGKPDLFVLRKLCWEKFGWSTQKADELLQPVLKEYNKHETQLRLEAFYTFNERFAKIRSKRIKKAVRGITGNKSSELMDDFMQEGSKSRKKSRMCPSEAKKDKSEKPLSGTDDCITRDENHSTERSTAKRSIKRKLAKPLPSEARNLEPLCGAKGRQNTRPGLSARGVRAAGRGRRKKDPGLACVEDSSDYGSNSDYEQDMQVKNLEGLHGVRKSTRTRKAVKYTSDDLEIDDLGKTQQDEENCSDEEAVQEGPPKDHGLFGDTAASPGEKNDLKVGDPSLVENSSGGYLEIGAGFCIDEAEPELSLGQHGEPSFEVELSKEYIKMGGGFCLSEDGTNKDPNKCVSEPTGTSKYDDASPVHCSNFVAEADTDIGPIQSASSPPRTLDGFKHRCRTEAFDSKQNLDRTTSITNGGNSSLPTSPPESIRKDDSGTAPVQSLCAMPYLRRKRRKS